VTAYATGLLSQQQNGRKGKRSTRPPQNPPDGLDAAKDVVHQMASQAKELMKWLDGLADGKKNVNARTK
jgi:hypothetical protein